MKTVAQKEQMLRTGTLEHGLAGEEKFQAKGFLATDELILFSDGKCTGVLIADLGIAFNAGNVGDPLAIELFEPLMTDELPIHRKHINSFARHYL